MHFYSVKFIIKELNHSIRKLDMLQE